MEVRMTTVLVGERYQVVIPKEIRERVGVEKHARLQVSIENDGIVLRVPKASSLRGIGRALAGGTDATAYVRELRAEWETGKRK
jgi:AbrB family looped-hinge helix DNA binding protein